ncbi:MAG: polyphosphate kinase 1, partial [Betaproteobacteria bacterium]|nr:polyphosphate kinase 1 [Betaproteobacteria bacterium]
MAINPGSEAAAPAQLGVALAAPPPAAATSGWLSREGSILAFNRRILAQSRYADVPVLERLRYITIVSSNLDEFFEVRFADLL